MSTRYLEILSVQSPFTIGVDENNRTMFSVNFNTMAAAPSDELEKEIVKLLTDASLGTFGTDIFIGPAAVIPQDSGPYIQVISTGGTAPIETHDGNKYERPSVQLIIRGLDYEATETRALAAWRALDGVRNQTVTA